MAAEMFLSSNNGNVVDPISYSRPIFSDITSNSKHHLELDQSFLHLLSSPFNSYYDQLELEDHEDLFHNQNGEFLLQQEQPEPLKGTENSIVYNTGDVEMNNKIINPKDDQILTRKKCSKRDRHSKINTAQGPRDRRMRLSLKVAREFFDLQDKLCFDKASKTVEWLLLQARSAINKLSGNGTSTIINNQSRSFGDKSASSTSECEVVSGIEDEAAAIKDDGFKTSKAKTASSVVKGKKAKPSRKTAIFHPQAKESREKARARARDRTRERQERKKIESEEAKINEFNQLSCWSDPFETGEESATQSHSFNPSITEVEPPATSQLATSESITDESWAIGRENWSPFPPFSHLYKSGFPQEQNEITDFPSFCNQYGSLCDH